MKRGIVFKLFILTTALCTLVLGTTFVGQTIFFKQYYVNKKITNVKNNIQLYKEEYLKVEGDAQRAQKLEEEFYQNNNIWITTLDKMGNIENVNDFYIEVKVTYSDDKNFNYKTIKIPLYSLGNVEEISKRIANLDYEKTAYVYGIKKEGKLVPFMFRYEKSDIAFQNDQIARKQEEIVPKLLKPAAENSEFPSIYLYTSIKKIQIPKEEERSRFIYTNHLFIDKIKEFQANLLLNKDSSIPTSLQVLSYRENDVQFKILIEPITNKDGSLSFIYALMSLQPVDEAIEMMNEYYVYIIVFVLVLIILSSYYYSKRIARPLLKINTITKNIANRDFTEKIPVKSKDEIGDLSKNINELSDKMHSHIEILQSDIEKEKKLETTRKEFISGVSHELKTPLSIIKSCISILKDGVAIHKRDYYFEAMEKEVDRMDMLIVDMLELAKFESGTYNMKMDYFYIDEVIYDLCEQLSLDIEKKQLDLHIQLVRVQVIANKHRIEQVITNFITNAIRYTPEQEKIIISVIEESGVIRVSVENKGAHIPEEQLDKIWERFYRGDTSRKRATGGTGLGLAISKNILNLHGAKYGAYNTEDGVLFFFYLNMAKGS